MPPSTSESETVNLNRLTLRALRRLVWVVLGSALVAAAVWALSRTLPHVYEASVLIHVSDPPLQASYGTSLLGAKPPDPDPRLLIQVILSEEVAGGIEASGAQLNCVTLGKNNYQLTVRGPDAAEASALADRWAVAALERLRRAYTTSDEAIAEIEASAAEMLARWSRLHERSVQDPPTGFALEQLRADMEVARNLYVGFSQASTQSKITREASRGTVSIVVAADRRGELLRPHPHRYALVGGLLAFAIGLFAVLVVEMSRLER